jgi:FkbM family methyltransferase
VYVSLSKNLSYVLSSGSAGEEDERKNFIGLVKLAGFRRFFDVGANIGLYGFIFRTIVPDGVVTMLEPDEDNAQLIRRTIDRVGLMDVHLVQAAASDSEGALTFYKDELSGATGSIQRGGKADAFVFIHHRYKPREVSVASVTLNALASRYGDPDLIKIDVEGAELSVLHGAAMLIERSHPALFFECDENQDVVGSFLSERGYVFFDFSTMSMKKELAHNSLALHLSTHATLLDTIRGDGRL